MHVTDAYSHGLPGDGDGVRYLGYVLDTPDGRVYHAGDTLRWDGQAELLRRHRVDLALLPINGRDAEREARTSSATWTPPRPWPWPATPPWGRSRPCTTT